jgi:hypothetical protein
MGNDDIQPDEATKEAEETDATQAHVADRPPTSDEETAADKSRETYAADGQSVAEHYEEMSDIGAHVKGEGAIE